MQPAGTPAASSCLKIHQQAILFKTLLREKTEQQKNAALFFRGRRSKILRCLN